MRVGPGAEEGVGEETGESQNGGQGAQVSCIGRPPALDEIIFSTPAYIHIYTCWCVYTSSTSILCGGDCVRYPAGENDWIYRCRMCRLSLK